MILQKYDSYKDSGEEYLGKIPEEWSFFRIDKIGTIIRGNTGFTKDELLKEGTYVALQYGKTYKVNEVNESFNFYVNDEFYKPSQVVTKGDIVLISTSETLEDLGHTCFYNRNSLGLIGGEQILLKPNPKFIFDKYMFYFSKVFSNEFKKYATGLKVYRFNTDNVKNIFISIPSKEEQTQIASFLEKKTSQIDSKIRILQEKITSYEELKKSVINETVCRGLNKEVELKDSEIEWIGEVPSHWKIERLKNIFNERVEKNLKLGGEPITDNILSVMKDIGVINHRDKGNVGNKMSEDITGYKIVHPKDIVVNKMNVIIGSVGISKEYGALSVIYIILKTKPESHPEFYDYVFRSKYFQKYLRTIATGILEIREAVNSTLFKHQGLPNPPKEEQIQIAKYLDEKTTKIDNIISKIKDQVETLKEFRKTLINDIVTGKVRVPNE